MQQHSSKITRAAVAFLCGTVLFSIFTSVARADGDPHAEADAFAADAAALLPAAAPSIAAATTPLERVTLGEWGAVIPWTPHIPVSAATLPDGRLLTFASNQRTTFPSGVEFTYAATWDPATGVFVEYNHPSHDMFCGGLVMLPDGRVLVNGGRNTTRRSSLFDWRVNTWTRTPDMNDPRWYNTTVALPNGRAWTVTGDGGSGTAERWDSASGWSRLTGINWNPILAEPGYITRWHPFVLVAPDGRLIHFGPTDTMHWVSPDGSGSVLDTGTFVPGTHYPKEGAWVMFNEGRILVAGGGTSPVNNASDTTTGNSTNAAYTVDVSTGTPVITPVASMTFKRQFANAVVLPNGEVMLMGGNTSGLKFNDTGSVLTPEIWNPTTGQWRSLANAATPRNYHSLALLLPDGRVLSGGGGLSGNSADHRDAELFTPPTLFNADGTLAPRPTLATAPATIGVATSFSVTGTPGIQKFSFIKMSAITHSVNTDLRFLSLPFIETSSGNYEITAHANLNVMTPGYWMLFGLNAAGAHSVAKIILVGNVSSVSVATPGAQASHIGSAAALQMIGSGPVGSVLNWSATGLPTGLTINSANGLISGTPTVVGTFSVVVTLANGNTSATANFNWIIQPVTFSQNFTSFAGASGLTLNGNAAFSGGALRLTTNLANQVGSAFLSNPIVIGPDTSIATRWVFRTHGSADGADGLTFMIQGNGPTSIGAAGGGLGYQGISRSVAVEIDNYQGPGDPNANHLGILTNGDTTVHLATNPPAWDLENGLSHTIWVDYDGPANQLRIYAAEGNVAQRPASPVMTTTIDLPALVVGGQAWFGFSGGTGGVFNNQDIESWSLSVNAFALPAQPVFATPANATNVISTALNRQLQATDPNGDLLAWSAAGLPTGLAISPTTGLISGTPTVGGVYSPIVTVTDGSTPPVSASFTWTIDDVLTVQPLSGVAVAAGSTVSLTAQASGGLNRQYRWNFGDGSPDTVFASSPASSHPFPLPGRFLVTVTVRDDTAREVTASYYQAVYAPPTAIRPTASTSLVYESRTNANSRLWVVNPDNDSVTVFDAITRAKLAEINVGRAPRSLALAPDGRVWVANAESATVTIIQTNYTIAQTVSLARGSRPFGLVFDPAGLNPYVALEAGGKLLKLNPTTGATLATLDVGPNVRHLSVTADGAKILATRFITPRLPGEETASPQTTVLGVKYGGEVLTINRASFTVVGTVILEHNEESDTSNSARGIPNYLGAAVISPDGQSAWVPSKQDNIKRGTLRNGGTLTHDMSLRSIASRINLATQTEDIDGRIDFDNAGIASAAAFDPQGIFLFTALEGSREVAVADAVAKQEILRFPAGRAPQGLVLSPDGRTLFVQNFMDRTLSVHDLNLLANGSVTPPPAPVLLNCVTTEKLAANVLVGKQVFYDAQDNRIALQQYISCASCHNDGGQDGRVWDFTQFGEGLRNTTTLRGHGGTAQGPLHWTGNFDEVQDFEGQIRNFAGGIGLMSDANFHADGRDQPLGGPKAGFSADLDALAAYLNSLTQNGDSPDRNADGTFTSAALAGQTVFQQKNCAQCHSGTQFTDSALNVFHAIGPLKSSSGQRLGSTLTGLDTPTLRGLWANPPYLHDGSAATLEAAVSAHTGVALTAGELSNLVAFLRQLDDTGLAAPTIGAIANQLTTVNTQTPAILFTVNDSDTLVSAVTVSGSSSNPTLVPNGNILFGGSGGNRTVTLSPAGGQTGTATITVTANDGANSTSINFVLAVQSGPPAIATTSLPSGLVNTPYSAPLTASGGIAPYAWSLASGALPEGLTLNTSSGAISGTPTTVGTWNFTARVSDAWNPVQTATQALTITVTPTAGAVTLWSGTVVPGLVDGGADSPVELGVKFRSDVNGSVTGIKFYKASANTGSHMANLWTSTGSLLGSATFAGETASGWQQVNFAAPVPITSNTVYVASYHANNGHYSADVNYFSAAGVDNPPLHALADGVSGGNGVYAYGASSAFPNSTWNAANYWVDVVFQPGAVPTLTSLVVTPASASLLAGATQAFTATGTYSDGSTQNVTGQATWTSSSPTVATVNASGLATAVAPGTSTISAALSGKSGSSTLSVQAAPVTITTTTLSSGTVNASYSATLTASGGTASYSWSITGGSLPPGLSLNPGSGVISGTPTTAGTFNFTAQVSDGSAPNQTATKALSLTVAPALSSIAVTPANPSLLSGSTLQLTATGTYSDTSTQDLTSLATWTSSSTAVATVSASGLATGMAAGTASISAALAGQTGSTPLTILPPPVGLGDYRSVSSGVWSNAAVWQTNNGSAWFAATQPPTNATTAGVITVQNGHGVTVTAAVSVDQVVVATGGQITVNSGQTLTLANGTGTDLSVSGLLQNAGTITVGTGANLAFNAGGTYQHNLNGGTIPTATWAAASTCLITGTTTTLPGGRAQAFGHFTWNCASQTANLNLETNLSTAGNFTVSSTGTGTLRLLNSTTARTLTVGGHYNQSGGTFVLKNNSGVAILNVAGNFNQTGGTFTLRAGSTTGTGTVNVTQDFNLSLGTFNLSGSGAVGTLNVGGNFAHTGGTLTETSTGSGAVIFTSGLHTNTSGGTVANTINYTVNSGATVMLGASLLGNGSSGTFTLASGGTLGIGDPVGITTSGATGNVRVTGTRSFNTGANYIYQGPAAQVPGNGLPATVNNLTVSSPGGLTLNTTHTVNGTCLVAAGARLLGTGMIAGGPMVLNGTVAPGVGVGRFTTAGQTWNGGAGYSWDINNATGVPATGWDLLSLTNGQGINLQAAATNPVTLKLITLNGSTPGLASNFNKTNSYVWTLAIATNAAVTNFAADKFVVDATQFSNDFSGGTFSVEQLGSELRLKFAAVPTAPAITTIALPNGVQDAAYSGTLAAIGGIAPYNWSISSGSLPAGLTLNATNGGITGSPSALGTFNFTVQVSDASNPVKTATKALSLTITPVLTAIAVTPANPGILTGGTQSFTATGTYSDSSTQNITTQVAWTSATPGVATMNASGLATGISAGTTTVSAVLAGVTGSTVLTVQAPLLVTTAALPNGTVNSAYTTMLTASGGSGAYTWSLASGTLPSGLTLNTASGVIEGTPTIAGTASITVQVSDTSLPVKTATKALSITITPSLTSIAVTPVNPTNVLGATRQFVATGTYSDATTQILTNQVTWASSSPAVATINASGLVTGVTVGTTAISATIGSVSGNTTLTIQPPPLAITTTSLPNGTVSTTYTTALAASGGTAPYTWSLLSGSLPAGLTLSPSGAITGTPTTAGTSSITVRAADVSNPEQNATNSLNLTINTAGTPGLIGNPAEGTLTDYLWFNGPWINAGRYQAASNMTVTSMQAKVGAISGKYKCAIYTDNNGQPSGLLRSTLEVSNPATGWQTFPLTSALNLTNGQFYWLAIWSDDANAQAFYSSTAGTLRWQQINYGNWPNPMATSGGGTFNYCIYAVGTAPQAVANLPLLAVNLQPTILSLKVVNGTVTITSSATAGRSYVLEYVKNLGDPTWVQASPSVTATGTMVTLTDTVGDTTRRFYRAVELAP